MFVLLSLGTFFLFCSFETVLFWKYYKHDTCGMTLRHISNSNAVVSRHVEFPRPVFYHLLLFLKVWRWEILLCRAPTAKSNSQKTISWGYRYFRFAWRCKDRVFFFHKISLMLIVACNSNSDLQPVTCNLQITPSGYEGSNSGFAIKPKKKENNKHTLKHSGTHHRLSLFCSFHWRKSNLTLCSVHRSQ